MGGGTEVLTRNLSRLLLRVGTVAVLLALAGCYPYDWGYGSADYGYPGAYYGYEASSGLPSGTTTETNCPYGDPYCGGWPY